MQHSYGSCINTIWHPKAAVLSPQLIIILILVIILLSNKYPLFKTIVLLDKAIKGKCKKKIVWIW